MIIVSHRRHTLLELVHPPMEPGGEVDLRDLLVRQKMAMKAVCTKHPDPWR